MIMDEISEKNDINFITLTMFPSRCPVVNLGVLKDMGFLIHPDPVKEKM